MTPSNFTFSSLFVSRMKIPAPPIFDAEGFQDVLDKLTQDTRIRKKSLVYRHSGEIPSVDPPDPSVDIEIASESLINQVVTPQERCEKFIQFINDGYTGFFAHDGEELIARGWLCRPTTDGVPYSLPDWIADLDVYWLTHACTTAAYRTRGWHKYLVARRLKWVYERDPNAHIYTDAAPTNVSRCTFVSTGFEPCGTITTYRIGHPSIGVIQTGSWNPDTTHPPMPNNL